MGLWDLFKRKSVDNNQTQDKQIDPVPQVPERIADEPPKQAETRSVEEPEMQQHRRRMHSPASMESGAASETTIAEKTQPIEGVKPVVPAKPVMEAKPAANPGSAGVRQGILWPKNGSNAAWMASSRFFVYADAGFLRSTGALAFIEAWRIEKQNKGLRRFVFIPKFELDTLTPEELQRTEQWKDVCSVRSGQTNYEELFTSVSDKNWNIVFLTTQGEHNNAIIKAAADAGVSLKLYMTSDEGRIYAVLLSQANAGQRKRGFPEPDRRERETPVDAFGEPMKLAAFRRAKPPARIPAKGSVVYDDNGERICLENPVFSDSMSITYATNRPDMYAKIYTESMLCTTYPEQKCRLMLSRRIEIPGVCWPVSGLKTQEEKLFVGILVPKAEGVQLREALLRQSMVLKCFEGWDRQDMTRLAIIILKKFQELQKWHVCFGRLNLSAILVKDKTTVYFVDMDGWQIEGYPVLFENKIFDPPETQGEKTGLRFFNQDEMNYQIAYLMFMLMMPGRQPYVRCDGSTVLESIVKQEFAFGLGKDARGNVKSSGESGAGFWRFVWDHVNYDLAKSFYHTFIKGGDASAAGKRYSIEKWLNEMETYHRNLDRPYDPESRKLYPITFRRSKDRTFVKCSFCGVEHPDFYFCEHINVMNGNGRERIPLKYIISGKKICKTCYHESAKEYFAEDRKAFFTCEGCGEVIYYSVAAMLKHRYMEERGGWKPQKWCSNCKETYEILPCIDCGKAFAVTVGQHKSFARKGYALPKRCFECQRKKKGDWR